MTPKQQRFVREYLIDLNATRAYRAAGYAGNDNVCGVEGHKLLSNPKVAAAVADAQKQRSERTEITQDMVLRELAKIGFADMRRLLRWTGNAPRMDEDEAEETGEVQISVANLVTLFDSDHIDDEIAACISEISQTKDGALKVKLHDKQAALVSIGRHLGMFKDKLEVEVTDPFALLDSMTQNERRLRRQTVQ
jgi:phage terminase small subunit